MIQPFERVANLHRLLVESVEDCAICALDPAGVVLTWNAGAERLMGYRAEESIGRHFSIFYEPTDVAGAKPQRELEVAAREGRFADEGWRLRKDGSRFWANVIVTALRDPDGGVLGFGNVTRDLSSRRTALDADHDLQKERSAHLAAEDRASQLVFLTEQLQQQAVELEAQTEEAQAVTEELEQSNEQLQAALVDAEDAREAAAAAERLTRGILDSITDPLVLLDHAWRFQFLNDAAATMLRESSTAAAHEPIGKVMWELYPELIGTETERQMRRAVVEQVPITFESYYPQRGEWVELYCYPLSDGGLATQWRDVSARRRAEESAHYLAGATEVLSASIDYNVTLAELARLVVPKLADWCGVDVVGADGVARQLAVAHVDDAKVRFARELGERYPPDPDAPNGVPNVLRTGKPEILPEIPDELLVAGAVDAEHLKLIRALGLRSAMIVPLVARGRTLGALSLVSAESGRRYNEADLALAVELARRAALAVDNARLHQEAIDAKRQAELANTAKTDFLAVMSHELRTPLNAIAGYADLLRMGLRGTLTPEQDDFIQRIQRSEHHLLSLINDVLNFAKLDAGHVEYTLADVDVHALIDEMDALVLPLMRESGLTFQYSGCPTGTIVRADAEKLRQILLNLLSNAAKFTDPGGSVVIGCVTRGDTAVISVHDSGAGIPADNLESIFEPFVQLGHGLTGRKAGTGLGLAISRDMALAMGGELSVESHVGSGSTFSLTLRRG